MANDNEFIRFDWAVKHMLRDKSNFSILEGLISVLLGENITIVEILESESNQVSRSDKFNRVDVKAKNSKGHIIIVEVQLTRQLNYLERILYGVSKAIVEHLNLGDSYDKVKKVYSISILYCDMGKGDDYVYHGTTEFRGMHTGNTLLINSRDREVLKMTSPSKIMPEFYIIRVNQFSKIPENYLDEWVNYLKTGQVKEGSRAPGLPEVREKLKVLNMTAQERRDYDAHIDALRTQNDVLASYRIEGLEEGRVMGLMEGRAQGLLEGRAESHEQGLLEGRAEGRAEQAMDIARKMRDAGMKPDQIRSITGIDIE